jgi:hypothetical protein
MRAAVGWLRGGRDVRSPAAATDGCSVVTTTDVFSSYKANVSSGGMATKIELGDFLGRGKAGPEHQALTRIIGSLVDKY